MTKMKVQWVKASLWEACSDVAGMRDWTTKTLKEGRVKKTSESDYLNNRRLATHVDDYGESLRLQRRNRRRSWLHLSEQKA